MANGDANSVPDMVILDWRMPQISGKEVLARIRKLPHYTQIPIVIFTGILDPVHLEEAKELGATFFLRKPFDFIELYRKLEYLFSLDWRNIKSHPANRFRC
jgi:CheY-like chemotaxis protein